MGYEELENNPVRREGTVSRYVIEDTGRREVAVGWDPPLGTFFAQIFAATQPEDEEECIWWIGDGKHAVPAMQDLEAALAEQGITLTEDERAQLIADQQAPWTAGPLQRRFGFLG